MEGLKDILNAEEDMNQENLIKYLRGNATEQERYDIEKQMTDSSFMEDAVEGLQHFKNPDEASKYAEQLNHQLQKYTATRQGRKNRRKLKDQIWLVITILGILLLSVVGYLLIHYFSNRN